VTFLFLLVGNLLLVDSFTMLFCFIATLLFVSSMALILVECFTSFFGSWFARFGVIVSAVTFAATFEKVEK
jgi:hypothetical protein